MILCESGDAADMRVILKCEKMKDDEPFKDIGATLEKVALADGASSLVLGEAFDIVESAGQAADRIVEILAMESSASGLTHSKLKALFVELKFGSESTFARAWKYVKNTDRVRIVRENGKSLIFLAGVSVKPVSNECQTPTHASVMSPLLLRGDTDTKETARLELLNGK